jgi:divalent metal cation (Fe/Co/Zn/Cd) transporter
MDVTQEKQRQYYRYALWLSFFTIITNLAEGIVSTILGFSDETLALFGFGIDSFIEVISAVGITVMIVRLSKSLASQKSRIETLALRITAISFFLLTAGLVGTVALNLFLRNSPQSTKWGIVISLISLSVMIVLMRLKIRVGEELNSDPIIADAHCTRACIYMSVVLLVSSLLFTLTKIPYLDSLGALGIAYYSFKEGREAWEKANGKEACESC